MADQNDGDPKSSPKRRDEPPTGRLGRLARLASLAPRTLPLMMEGAKRALGKRDDAPPSEKERERLTADVQKAGEALLKTLGEMKGLPLKFGQMASYIDGLAPPGYEERFQAELKKLLDRAPPLSAEAAAKVVTAEFGKPPTEVFATWEAEPFAAASIGQVHRATTHGGELVAVKVQYPGIDRAIENDLKSLSMLESLMGPITKKLHTRQTLDEVGKVFLEELDYTREATMADLFRRLFEGEASVVVPRVHHALTTRRVLTLEFIEGIGYGEFAEKADQAAKNRAGLAIWRFTFRSLLQNGVLYADPHPGNYRFLPDGRVGFLDFGCVKILPADLVSGIKRYMVAAMDGDWADFDRACVEVLGFDPNDPSWDLYRSYALELLAPLTQKGDWLCSKEKARETVAYLSRGIRELTLKDGGMPKLPHVPKMPQDFTFVNRLQWGLASVLAGLSAEGPFRDMTEPWVRGPLVRPDVEPARPGAQGRTSPT